MTTLSTMKCVPCIGGALPMSPERIDELLDQLPGWSIENDHHLIKDYRFHDFAQALAFVNQIGGIAEEEGHHPDIYLSWGRVRVQTWTHKIDGLTESDFILAAKIDALLARRTGSESEDLMGRASC
jgi:4a-hydroxytetrahydrobiopterin dehydratase